MRHIFQISPNFAFTSFLDKVVHQRSKEKNNQGLFNIELPFLNVRLWATFHFPQQPSDREKIMN